MKFLLFFWIEDKTEDSARHYSYHNGQDICNEGKEQGTQAPRVATATTFVVQHVQEDTKRAAAQGKR